MQPIQQDLIIRALALTGKTFGEVCDIPLDIDLSFEFSYPNFFYYLLSPEFIEKYEILEAHTPDELYRKWIAQKFGQAIYEYQSGDEAPIIQLLNKI